jgi:hypothetical protein
MSNLKTQLAELQTVCDGLAEMLKRHHEHSSDGPSVHFADNPNPPGRIDEKLPTNLGEAYQESQMFDDTRDALCNYNTYKSKYEQKS